MYYVILIRLRWSLILQISMLRGMFEKCENHRRLVVISSLRLCWNCCLPRLHAASRDRMSQMGYCSYSSLRLYSGWGCCLGCDVAWLQLLHSLSLEQNCWTNSKCGLLRQLSQSTVRKLRGHSYQGSLSWCECLERFMVHRDPRYRGSLLAS